MSIPEYGTAAKKAEQRGMVEFAWRETSNAGRFFFEGGE
jgi:hypothetical protein